MGEMIDAYKILGGKSEGRNHSEDLGVDRKITLEWILGKWGGNVWIGCIWLRIGIMAGCCEHDNETSGFLKGEDFLTS
jgi:hypothetical protein